MDKTLSVCGLDCTQCPAFLAHQNGDRELQEKTAAEWSRRYGADVRPESVECTGCASNEGVLFSHCHVCDIRACGREKGVANCAVCPDYICPRLEAFLGLAPECRTALEAIRSGAD